MWLDNEMSESVNFLLKLQTSLLFYFEVEKFSAKIKKIKNCFKAFPRLHQFHLQPT